MLLTQLQIETGSLPVLFSLLAKYNINHCALWINSKTPGQWNTNTDAHLTNFDKIFFVNDDDTEQSHFILVGIFFSLHKEATVSCRLMGMNKLISNLNSTNYNKKLLYFQLKKNLFRWFLKITNVYFVYNCFANFILSGFLLTRFASNHKWLFILYRFSLTWEIS